MCYNTFSDKLFDIGNFQKSMSEITQFYHYTLPAVGG